MNWLYNIGIHLYGSGARIAALRSPKVHAMLKGHTEVFTKLQQARAAVAPDGFDLWVHAASLGEFEQGRPLIEKFKKTFPDKKVLLSFFSPSGYRVRKDYPLADAVVYLPFDTPRNARKFIEIAAPKCAIFVKYEFWGNYLEELSSRGIATYSISSIFRPTQSFFKPWGGWARRMLRKFTHIFVQDDNSQRLLADIGIENVTVAGDTRFDRVNDICKAAKQLPVIEKFTENADFTLIAGSSWPQDEAFYIPWFNSQNSEKIKLIIAPHEFDAERLVKLRSQILGAKLLSELSESNAKNSKAIIVDSFGLLSSIYRYGSAAWIGGGFGAGIHNINEAAVYGIPVVFGPRHAKFKEATDLMAAGAAFEVKNNVTAEQILDKLIDTNFREAAGRAAKNYISQNIGATDKIFAKIFTKISQK